MTLISKTVLLDTHSQTLVRWGNRVGNLPMAYKQQHYQWEWQLQSSPEQYWPFISDTNRFDYDRGNNALETLPTNEALSNARLHIRLPLPGINMEWEEEPFEWMQPYRYGVNRKFINSPIEILNLLAEVKPRPGGGSVLTYHLWVQPTNFLGLLFSSLVIGRFSFSMFDKAIRKYDEMAMRRAAPIDMPGRVTFAPGGQEQLDATRKAALAKGSPPELTTRLVELLEKADDLTLSRLRPYVLADYWGVPRRTALEMFLIAAHEGMLELRWDIMCPLCRVAKASDDSLDKLLGAIHCDTCNIDFTANFDRSVELSFRTRPNIRKAEMREFCLAGPQVTPHIIAQQLVPSGERRTMSMDLAPGRYRFRTLELRGGQFLTVTPDGAPNLAIHASDTGWPKEEPRIAPHPTLLFDNGTNREQLVIMERTAWSDQVVTAAELSTLPLFRELFGSQAVTPGEEVSVGSLTAVVFGMGGSAAGSGEANPLAQSIKEAIDYEQGTLVRFDGDDAIAVFARPLSAMRAAVNLHVDLSPSGANEQIRIGLHHGPCIATLVDNKINYLGSTISLAQRITKNTPRGCIVLTSNVSSDAHAAKYINNIGDHLLVQPFLGVLKGFDTEGFEMWEVNLTDINATQRVTILRL
jgi:Family of unknown function (DUF5939)